MSTIVLEGTKVSSQKIEDAGYTFKYPDVAAALNEIYG
jgi:NAD dependent epimerase/dehydratase family enzyme